MEVQLLDKGLLEGLHEKAATSERKRQNFDLRTTPEDGSQRMLNVLEVGTKVPIHRHLKTSESVICLEGCLDWVFYEEMDDGRSMRAEVRSLKEDGRWIEEDGKVFKETARFRVCPRENVYGIQVPLGVWHSIEVHEPSTIFEAKDGRYGG